MDVYLDLVTSVLGTSASKGKAFLDLGCGTGTFLQHFSSENRTKGIDLSPENIRIAIRKDSKSVYLVDDITIYRSNERYDIVTCCFDTINHIVSKE